MIVALYNCMPFKEVGGGNDSKNIFIEFVMLTFFLTISGFSSFVPIDSGYHLVTFAHVSIALFPDSFCGGIVNIFLNVIVP